MARGATVGAAELDFLEGWAVDAEWALSKAAIQAAFDKGRRQGRGTARRRITQCDKTRGRGRPRPGTAIFTDAWRVRMPIR